MEQMAYKIDVKCVDSPIRLKKKNTIAICDDRSTDHVAHRTR